MSSAVQSRSKPPNAPPAIRPFQPKAEPAPTQLRLLPQERPSLGLRAVNKLRQLSTPIAFIMVLGVLPIYGWSVLTQRSWGTGYQRLEQLRRDENMMIQKTEAQKHDITEQAEVNPKGLVPQGPGNTLLMPRSQPRPNVVQVPQRTPFNPDGNPPLAY
jgi:hypothetical protein